MLAGIWYGSMYGGSITSILLRVPGEGTSVMTCLVTSMYVGNLMLLVLNIPLIGLFTRITRVSPSILASLIILFCLAGAYSVNNNPLDTLVMVASGVVGYLMTKFGYDAAPLVLGFVLGPMLEIALRQSLILSQGSFAIFFSRPIAGLLLGLALFTVLSQLFLAFKAQLKARQTRYSSCS